MKFREIFRYEFNYQLRSPRTWLIFIALAAFAFLFVRVNFIADALYADHFVNAPFLIAGATVFGGLIWLGVAAFIAGEAAARDTETRMYPLVYTAPVGKAAYLGGGFLASLAINALLLLGVQAGILLAYYLPGTDTGQLSPFRPAAYLTAYAIISLPNALVATAIQYLLALRSGRAMAGYLGSFLLVFMGFFVASALLYHYGLGGLLDPIGIRFVVEDLAHLWTTIEQNTRLIGLEGRILTNRLLWVAVALASLVAAYLSFNFSHRAEQSPLRPLHFILRKIRLGRSQDHALVYKQQSVPQNLPVLIPRFQKNSGFKTAFSQVFAIATDSLQYLAGSWAGLALLLFVPLVTVPVVIDQLESVRSPVLPTTLRVLGELTAPLSAELSRWVIVPLIIVFFAGELVWRERDYRLGDLTDALPVSEWVPLLGKFLGLSIILTLFLCLQMMAGMLAQTMLGYQKFEIGLYLKILFGFQLADYLLFALLALVVHVVVHQKYVGHLVAIVAFVYIAMAPMFGIEHNLLIYGASPGWSYTEIRGFGPSLVPWLWFKAYWAAWALLLAVAARLLWARGREEGLRARLRGVRNRLTRTSLGMATVAAGLVLSLGGFIFYNTNVINEYLTSSDTNARKAEYERRYSQYATVPQPRLTATRIHVEIYPRQRVADIRGTYLLVNKTTVAIDSIHVGTGLGAKTEDIDFGQLATLAHTDEALHHRIYTLKKSLLPGDSLRLSFRVRYAPRGFREDGVDDAITAHGTSITSSWLPTIGYDKSRELLTPGDRREFGLTPRPLIASLYDVSARKTRGSGVSFEAVVGTDVDQVALAPGALRRSWTDSTTSTGKRRYFHYATSAPIGSEWAVYSARYAVRKVRWQDVVIRIYHHPTHTAHLDRTIRSIRSSLDYYTRHFGPYTYNHLSVVERPGSPGTGMHAEAGMITHGEGFTYYNPPGNPLSYDHPSAVVAHEMAHQWTVPYANVEGAPVMSESLAWYYAIKAVENTRGEHQLQRLLEFLRESQVRPEIRRGEPLLRGLDPYMSYRRGPFALYTLSKYLGEKQVNGALRQLLAKHRAEGTPLATTLDLYRELREVTPDSLRYLLHDLFEVNTTWLFDTKQAAARQTAAGTWQVTFEVEAQKTVMDSAGVETTMPVNQWVEIGVFAAAEPGEFLGKPLYVRKHFIRSGPQTITVTVPHKPARGVIDPYNLLDREEGDHIQEIQL